jgi:endonuclease YncB( thermonuclease family)
MKNKFKGYFTFRRIAIGSFCLIGFAAWYAFGFWSVIHPKKFNDDNSQSYAAKQAMIKKLVIDPNTLYPVVRVVDGDTFIAKLGGQDISVRVLGENAPETVKPHAPVECYGPEASEEDKSILTGHSVYLEVDPTQDKVDFYGRLLAYVHRDDGLFLEEHMIQDGFAREYTFDKKKPYEYQKEFQAEQVKAQAGKVGLWGKCTISP